MPHIVDPPLFKSKKDFKAAVESGKDVYLHDPGFHDPKSGRVSEIVDKFHPGTLTVTNHPKRSWYAQVVRDKTGKIRVK